MRAQRRDSIRAKTRGYPYVISIAAAACRALVYRLADKLFFEFVFETLCKSSYKTHRLSPLFLFFTSDFS